MAKLAQLPTIRRVADPAANDAGRVPRLRTRYYAFLSYSHKDKDLADWLHRELEKFRVPNALAGKLTANGVVPRRLVPIFRDQHDLPAGDDLAVEIEAALAASQFLVVLCSPIAAKSRWMDLEIESFKRTRPEGCVLAAVAAGEPFASDIPGSENEECFPPALRFKYDRRGHRTTKRADPLAADFREGGEGRRLAFLKLVAGMLGVGLDDLVQRQTTRHRRQLAWVAAASLAGMAVTSTLAATAIQSRNEAREQRREAEGLVEFMVGDLRAKLEPIGRLDALDGVGSRVLAYYQKQDASELSDAALLQRSRALNLMAEVAYMRGNMAEADGLYRQAMAGTAEAIRRSPDDPQRIFDHAQNVFWLGEIARFRGNADQALADYTEYKRLGDQLAAMQPDNLKWRMEALYGLEDVGIALYNKRRFGEAARQFAAARGPMENLASVDPDNRTYQSELPKVFAWLADAQGALGNLPAAINARERQVALLSGAIARGATDVSFRAQLITAHQGLGNLLMEHGDAVRAIEEMRAAVDEAHQLIPIEPTNQVWKSTMAGAQLDLANAFLSIGQVDEAAGQTQSACALVAAVGGRNSVSPKRRACFTLRSRVALRSGEASQALAFARQALASAESERREDPVQSRYSIANAYRLLGDAYQRSGDAKAAQAAWEKALTSLPEGIVERPMEADDHALILERLGRSSEAKPRVSRLNAIGYRRQS
jgi:eukaryotic-like serine/threonine-protein kinase